MMIAVPTEQQVERPYARIAVISRVGEKGERRCVGSKWITARQQSAKRHPFLIW